MKTIHLAAALGLSGAPASAHLGHLGALAGHDHVVAGAAAGAAALAGLLAAWRGRRRGAPSEAPSEGAPEASAEPAS